MSNSTIGFAVAAILCVAQLLAVEADEKSEAPLCDIALGGLLGEHPRACHMVGYAIQEERDCGPEFQRGKVRHPSGVAPLQDWVPVWQAVLFRALNELLQHGDGTFPLARVAGSGRAALP
eukprot:CAMPEP_0170601176 /NCGR_PEP_ID=MMETSP0224-20130122/17721_1 /TAXON_ID=285029 /ORGANISM="Togula jolla, Strain CCCM 725" /LENGTH=119 /DNA_ID=CAMNT_0010925937 /DNA_START=760 /DNA_END=1115 /DNA_ORIENTATION=+